MKRFTKVLSMLLAIVMVVGLLPLSVIADDIQNTHTVQFKLNYNGAHKIPSQKVTDGECAVQPENVTREGWIFKYWYVMTSAGRQKFDLTQPITKDMILYAHWTEDIEYWGPIWNRNIVGAIEDGKKEEKNGRPYICDDIEDLKRFNDNELPEILYNENGTIHIINGVISDIRVNNFNDAITALYSVKNIIGIASPIEEFIGLSSNSTEYLKSYVLQQVYQGIPVYGRTVTVVTTPEGVPDYMPSGYLSGISISTEPSLSENEVMKIVADTYGNNINSENMGLQIYSLDGYENTQVLVYMIYMQSRDEIIFVDSSTGVTIAKEKSSVNSVNTTFSGNGYDELGNSQDFQLTGIISHSIWKTLREK